MQSRGPETGRKKFETETRPAENCTDNGSLRLSNGGEAVFTAQTPEESRGFGSWMEECVIRRKSPVRVGVSLGPRHIHNISLGWICCLAEIWSQNN